MGGAFSTEHRTHIADYRLKRKEYKVLNEDAEQRIQGTDYKITVFAWYVEYRLQSKEYRGG